MVSLDALRPPLYQPRTTAQIRADFLASGLTAAEYLFCDSPELRAERIAERARRNLDEANADMKAQSKPDLAVKPES